MAKPNYSFEKRQRELAKKKKKEEKRQRKAAESLEQPKEGETASVVEGQSAENESS
jgi:hypothetical protein|tara:strand:+ start:32239 stop:32406 length:168 start_codon:yes stop_codon:yes gene_type:complete